MRTGKPKYAYHLQSGSGNGCAMEPPGHPRYYTRAVYTPRGNTFSYAGAPMYYLPAPEPGDGSSYDAAGAGWWTDLEDVDQFYKPLPLKSARVQAWILDLLRHFRHCWDDAERPEHGRAGTLIYPLPYYKLRTFKSEDDPRFSEAYRATLRAAINQYNADEEAHAAAIVADMGNHTAVRIVRQHYPGWTPDRATLNNPPEPIGHWYETLEARPAPENCPGEARWSGSGNKHPVNGSWCQVCGWHAEPVKKS